MAKQTTITITTDTLLALRTRTAGHAWCERCGSQVEAVALCDAGDGTASSGEALQRWPGAAELHWLRGTEGAVYLCLGSLLAWMQTTTRGIPPPHEP